MRSPRPSAGSTRIVFTGGIGENSAEIRRTSLPRSAWLGVELDEAANAAGGPRISHDRQPAFQRG